MDRKPVRPARRRADRLARPPAPALRPGRDACRRTCDPAPSSGLSVRRAGHGPSAPARLPSPGHPRHSKDGLRPAVPLGGGGTADRANGRHRSCWLRACPAPAA